MKVNPYILLSLIFLALSLTMKSIPQLDIQVLKFFNTLMYNKTFFRYFTEIGNGLVCLAVTVPLLSMVSSKTQLNNVKVQTLVFVGLGVGLIVKLLKELTSLFAVRPGFYELLQTEELNNLIDYAAGLTPKASSIITIDTVKPINERKSQDDIISSLNVDITKDKVFLNNGDLVLVR